MRPDRGRFRPEWRKRESASRRRVPAGDRFRRQFVAGASISGWRSGVPGGSRSESTRWRAMVRAKGRILYDSSGGVPGNPAKGTRLRSSDRCSGVCQAAPRDYQAQSQPTSSAEASCEAWPSWGRRGTSGSGRPHSDSNRPGGSVAGCPAVSPGERWKFGPRGDVYRGAAVGPSASDLAFRLDAAGGLREGRDPKSATRARWIAKLHSKGRILYDRAKGCLETQRKGLDFGRATGVAVSVGRLHGTTRRSPNPLLGGGELRSVAVVGETRDEREPPPTPVEPSGRQRGGMPGGFSRRPLEVRSTRRYPAAGPQ